MRWKCTPKKMCPVRVAKIKDGFWLPLPCQAGMEPVFITAAKIKGDFCLPPLYNGMAQKGGVLHGGTDRQPAQKNQEPV